MTSSLARVRSFFRALFGRRRVEREMDEEWQFHREQRVDALVAGGLPRSEADAQARREFGDPLRWKEQAREVRGLGPLQDLGADVRCAVRQVRRAPGVAAVIVCTLALAIGAGLTIFSLIDRVVLRPVHLPDSSRIVMLQRIAPVDGTEVRGFRWQWFQYERIASAPAFESIAASGSELERIVVSLNGDENGTPLLAKFVSASYLRVLGVPPVAGRDFYPSDDEAGAPIVAILGHRAWHTRFGGNQEVLGRVVRIGDWPVTIAGVAPTATPDPPGAPVPDLLLPLHVAPRLLDNGVHTNGRGRFGLIDPADRSPISPVADLTILARLRPGFGIDAAQRNVASLLPPPVAAIVVPLREALLPFESRADLVAFLALLAAAVGVMLVIGVSNVTGLVLARLEERRSEFAVRAALGAEGLRLARQVGVELFLLTVAGGACALLMAWWIDRAFASFALPGGIAIGSLRTPLDLRMVAAASVLCAGVALAMAFVSVASGRRRDLSVETRRTSGPSRDARVRQVALGLQVSCCVVLVFAAGLFVRSLSAALGTNLGFDPQSLVSLSVASGPGGNPLQWVAQFEAFVDRARRLPGVAAAAVGPVPLVQESDRSTREVTLDGAPVVPPVPLEISFVGADYLTTLRQPLVRGRDFTVRDTDGSSALAIVNETAALLLWGHDEPLGRHIAFDSGVDVQIVGVARNAKTRALAESSRPAVYVARSKHPSVQVAVRGTTAGRGRSGTSYLTLRTTVGPVALADALHRAAADAGVTIDSMTTLEEAVDALVMPQRLGRALLAGLSLTAVVATLIGIAGLVSGTVARRTKEIGVRMALGASSGEVLSETVRSTLLLVLAGLAGGSVAAWWSGRLAERFLYGVGPSDSATLVAAVLLLGITAVVAAVTPALRVLRIDPVTVLRAE